MTAGSSEALIQRLYEVIARTGADAGATAELEHLLHPEVEYVNPPDALEPGTRTGVAGMRAAFDSALAGLGKNATFDVLEAAERGSQVFATVAIRTGGTASGVEVDGPVIGTVWTLEDGRIRRFEWFWKPEDARARFESADA